MCHIISSFRLLDSVITRDKSYSGAPQTARGAPLGGAWHGGLHGGRAAGRQKPYESYGMWSTPGCDSVGVEWVVVLGVVGREWEGRAVGT